MPVVLFGISQKRNVTRCEESELVMDTVANLLSQIQNAYLASHQQVETEWSKLRQALAELLAEEGYIKDVKVEEIDKTKKKLVINLRYDKEDRPMITKIKRVSKPGRRVYTTVDKIPVTLGGMGTTILSTSKGLMNGRKAKKENLGGEIICQIY
jgi:small subunit ribosomal protein S8